MATTKVGSRGGINTAVGLEDSYEDPIERRVRKFQELQTKLGKESAKEVAKYRERLTREQLQEEKDSYKSI